MEETSNTKTANVAEIIKNGNETIIYPVEPLTIKNSRSYNIDYFQRELKGSQKAVIDASKLKDYDSYFVMFVKRLENFCGEENIPFELRTNNERQKIFYNAFALSLKKTNGNGKSRIKEYIESIGVGASSFFKDIRNFITFIGDFNIKFAQILIHPSLVRWKEIPFQFLQNGANALPITLLIVFLIGIISGYQGARQLAEFGADIYIADLIGISITRELSPIMTAILVAGRSGSAFAAEIGTMKVSEEVDALKSMGFDTMHFLVIPRVLSVMIAMPLLTMLGNIAGIIGGMFAAGMVLDLSIPAYLNELKFAILVWDVIGGLIKSIAFGMLIALVGCFRGMQVKGGAESVGRYTTASVVTGILLIIIADSMFTFLYQSLGI